MKTPHYRPATALSPVPPLPRLRPLWVLAALFTALAAASWLGLPASVAQPAPPMALQPVSPSAAPATAAAALPPVAGEAIAHTCAACHGTQGRLGDEAFMPLAGLPRAQFVRTMQDFRSGARPSTLMGHVAQGFSDAELAAMGAYFESVPAEEAQR